MDDNTLPFTEDYVSQRFYDSSRCVPKPTVRRHTRHAASDVDFRADRGDLGRIPENDPRRKRRTKPQHCPSCLSQSFHDNSMDLRLNDHHRRKNLEKLEASLTQQLDYTTSKIASSLGKNRSVQQQGSLSSPRTVTAHQRSQHQRPGTSQQNRNNPANTMLHRLARKQGNIESCECTRVDSTLPEIRNSDVMSEDTDFRLLREQTHSRNICNESGLYWHSPSGEPHSEPEMDSPPHNRHRDYPESKTRHAGQGESVYENFREPEARVSIETGSSVDKDVRQQCERDKRELKDLYEDLDEFAKRKAAGWIVDGSREEDYAWEHLKQQREEKDEEADSQDLLESINQLVGKVSVQRKGNASRIATSMSTKGSKAHSKIPKEQSRTRSSKLDTRKTYHSVGMDGRIGAGGQQQELLRNLDDELAEIQPESLKQEEEKEEEETKEVEDLSETEEEARELAREDTETKQIHRQLSKSWASCNRHSSIWNPRIFGKGERTTRDPAGDKEEKAHAKPDCGKKRVDTRERSKGMRDREVRIREESEPLRKNHVGTNEAERKDAKWANTRARSRGKEDVADKMYEELKNCYGLSACHGAGDLELETSKTKTCIDEIIDSGLNREAKRASGGTFRDTAKDLQCEVDESDGGPSKRGPSYEPSKIIRPDLFCSGSRSDELPRANKADCFCKTLAEIVADCLDPREYVKKLKNCRWAYLNNMQSDLEKLYGLEKFLDSCSPERRSSSVTLTTAFSPEANESKNIRERRDKPKVCGTQSRH